MMGLPLQGVVQMKSAEETSRQGFMRQVIFEQNIKGKVCVCQVSRGKKGIQAKGLGAWGRKECPRDRKATGA